jgi:CheY-like chemotaxis protein/anti-sigma regulatory factor (Ser/Thr protein kinase)
MRFRYERCDIADSLEKICLLHRDRAESKGLALKWNISPGSIPFVTDESRVIQIVSNLLTNAIKYSGRGTVSLDCRKSDDGSLVLRVEDEGIGIPEDKREDIFTPFTQLESPYAKEHDGMGLGLPISRNIAREMGGSLDFTSGGGGSSFVLTLREAPAGSQPERQGVYAGRADTVSGEAGKKGKTILVVEDDAINLFILESLLAARGWNTLQAVNGEEALEELETELPDLVLLDMGLPRKSGLEVLSFIREREEMKGLPVLAVTAYSAAEDTARFEASGIDGIVTKPISEDLLFSEIDRVLNS